MADPLKSEKDPKDPGGARILPAHIEETIKAIAKLHSDHERQATGMQRTVSAMTRVLARPMFVAQLSLILLVWIGANLILAALGRPALDPPPFNGLQAAVGVAAVYMTALILAAQRHDDVLAGLREQLTLELAILAEQKSAKIISLIEEQRRDTPWLRDRVDLEARAMAQPTDPAAVLTAIQSRGSSEVESAEDDGQLDLFSPPGGSGLPPETRPREPYPGPLWP